MMPDNLLFSNAFSGCDTFAMFNQGNIKLSNILKNNSNLNYVIKEFKEPDAYPNTMLSIENDLSLPYMEIKMKRGVHSVVSYL